MTIPPVLDGVQRFWTAKRPLVNDLSSQTPNRPRAHRKVVFAATVTALLLVTGLSALFLLPPDRPGAEPTHSVGDSGSATFDGNQTVLDAIAEIQAIADASVTAVAEAGAAVEAEYNASLDAAHHAAAQAAAEAEGAVSAAGEVTGNLTAAPEDFDENVGVTVQPATVDESEFENGSYEYRYEFTAPGEGGDYESSNSSFSGRAVLNLPGTGIAQVDTTLSAAVEAYVSYKTQLLENITADNEVGLLLGDDYHRANNTEGYSYYEAPDEEGALEALAHANATLDNAFQAAGAARASVNASWEIELMLVAETEAQIEAAAEIALQAKADVEAEAEAKAQARFQAAADAEAEIHAEAEKKIEEAYGVRQQAKAGVAAETEGQVQAMYAAAADAEERLTAKASEALAAGDEAEAAIWAAADAQVQALIRAGDEAGVDTSAEAEAIASAAAEAVARARYSAQYTHDLFVRQAANARLNADARAEAMWDAAASAEARIDAQAEVAVKVILRAEAYAVARVHAEAQAQAEAYFATAHRLGAQIDQRYQAEVRALIRAAFSVHLASKGNLDTSRDLAELVRHDADVEVGKDVQYMRDVASDYERRDALPEYEGRADHWYDLASAVDTDGTGVQQYIDLVLLPEIEERSQTFVVVEEELHALQQKWT